MKAEAAPSLRKNMEACFPGMQVDLSTPPSTPPRNLSKQRLGQLLGTPEHTKGSQPRGVKRPVASPARAHAVPIKQEPALNVDDSGDAIALSALAKDSCSGQCGELVVVKAEVEPARQPAAMDGVRALADEDEDEQKEDPLDKRAEKQRQRKIKALVEKGGALCRSMKMDFHEVWHPKHRFMVAPGHWAEFRLAVATRDFDPITCDVCKNLLAEMDLDADMGANT